ncbi:MAG: hypothetical protein AB7F65_00855 [Dehalococcoidia bacterium]
MRFDEVVEGVLSRSIVPLTTPDEATWIATWRERRLATEDLDVMAALGGALSDRLAWVFLSGYQATIYRCFPGLSRGEGLTSFVNTEDRSGALPPAALSGEGGARRLNGWKGWVAASEHVERLLISARQEQTPFIVLRRETPGVRIESRESPSYLPELTQGRVEFVDVEVPDDRLTGDESTFPTFRVGEGAYIRVAFGAFILAHARRFDAPSTLVADALAALYAAAGCVRQPMPSTSSLIAAHAADRAVQRVLPDLEALLAERDPELLGRITRDRRLVTAASEPLASRAAQALHKQ